MPSPGRTVPGLVPGDQDSYLDHTSDSFKAAETNVQRMRLRESRAAACRSLAEGSMCPLCSLTSRHQQPSVHRPACVRRTRTKSAGAMHPRRKVPTRRHASCRVRWAREAPQESVAAGLRNIRVCGAPFATTESAGWSPRARQAQACLQPKSGTAHALLELRVCARKRAEHAFCIKALPE